MWQNSQVMSELQNFNETDGRTEGDTDTDNQPVKADGVGKQPGYEGGARTDKPSASEDR